MAADETTREALGSIGIQPKRGGEHRALQAHAQAPALAKLADLSADGSRVALLDCEGDRFVLRARGTSTSQAVDVDLPGSADATRLHTVVLSPCGAFACVHGAHNAFYVSLAPSTPHRVLAIEHELSGGNVWVRARWHPLARGTLVLGTKHCELVAFARVGSGLEQRLSMRAAGTSTTRFDCLDLVDFAFGSAPGWDQVTAYLAFDTGPVAVVCPFAPRGCILDIASMASLRAEATAVAAGATAEAAAHRVRRVRNQWHATQAAAQAARAWLTHAWHREVGASGGEHWVCAPPREPGLTATPRDFGPGVCRPVDLQPMRPLPHWHSHGESPAQPTSVCAARAGIDGAAPVVGLEASAAPVSSAPTDRGGGGGGGGGGAGLTSPHPAGLERGVSPGVSTAWPVLALLRADGVLTVAVVTRPVLPCWRKHSEARLAAAADEELEPPAAALSGEFGDARYDSGEGGDDDRRWRHCRVDSGAAGWWQALRKAGPVVEAVAADLGIVLCRGQNGDPYPRAGQCRAPWLVQDPEDPQLLLCCHMGGLSVVLLGDTERWCGEVAAEAETRAVEEGEEEEEEEEGFAVPPVRVEVAPVIVPGLGAPRAAALAWRTGATAAGSGHTLLVCSRRGALRCVSAWGALLRGHRANRVSAIDSAVQQGQRQGFGGGGRAGATSAEGWARGDSDGLTGDALSASEALAQHKRDYTAFEAKVTGLLDRLEAAKVGRTLRRGLAGERSALGGSGAAVSDGESEEEEGGGGGGSADAAIKRFARQVEKMSRRRVTTLSRLGDTLEARKEMLRRRQEELVRQVQRLQEAARRGDADEVRQWRDEAQALNAEMRRRSEAAGEFLDVLRQLALPLTAEEQRFSKAVEAMRRGPARKVKTSLQRSAQLTQRLQQQPPAPIDEADLQLLRAHVQTSDSKVKEAQRSEKELRRVVDLLRANVASSGDE